MVSAPTHLTFTTTSSRAPLTSKTCTTVSDRQASLQPITQVQRGMNSTSREGDRFHKKPRLTLRRSRHCSIMDILNTRQFTSGALFLGRKHRYLSIIPKRGDRDLVCIP